MKTRSISSRSRYEYTRPFAVLVACAALVGGAVAFGQSPSPRTRNISFSDRPIAEQLGPDDQVVIINRQMEGARFRPEPSARQRIEYQVRISDCLVVIDVDEVAGILAEGGTWVDTRIVGTISDVLMARKQPLSRGQRLEFHASGGEIRIGTVLVKAWDRPKVQPYKRYLVFLQLMPDTGISYPAYGPLLIENGRVANQSRYDGGREIPDPLRGLTLAKVKFEVSRAIKLWTK